VWPTYVAPRVNFYLCERLSKKTTDHIRGCKIAHDELVIAFLEDLGNFISDALDAHLRILVIGGDFGRRDHVPLFGFELLLDASIEKERDVGVFLGL
jgi:hypothetical protein